MTTFQTGKPTASTALVLAIGGAQFAPPALAQDSPSLTDRFKNLFGGSTGKDAPIVNPQADQTPDLNCPPVTIRAGASTYVVGEPGKPAVGDAVRFQESITRT